MDKLGRVFLVTICALLSSSCEPLDELLADMGIDSTQSLGDYDVEAVRFVAKPPIYGEDWQEVRFLRIDLVSSHQLTTGPANSWLGVASDFCPKHDDHKLLSSGPTQNDGATSIWNPLYSDAEALPIKSRDGNYRYQVFLVPEFPIPTVEYGAPATGPNAQAEYDILTDGRDICLQFFGGDHDHVHSRSSTFRVEFETISEAGVRDSSNELSVEP